MISKEDVLKKFDQLDVSYSLSDVTRVLEYAELLLKYNLNDLIKRLMAANKNNFLDTLAEYNFTAEILKYHLRKQIQLNGEIDVKYEAELGNRKPDLKIVFQGLTYWIQIKRSNPLEIENRKNKLVKEIEIRAHNIKIPRTFDVQISPYFNKKELNDLMAFIETQALSSYDKSYRYVGENGAMVDISFDSKNSKLNNLTLVYGSSHHNGDITGLRKTQIKDALSRTAAAFECANKVKINLIVLEVGPDFNLIDFCDAIYGTEYTEDTHNGFKPKRETDGLYLIPSFSDKVIGVIIRKRREHTLCSDYDQIFFANPNKIPIIPQIDHLIEINRKIFKSFIPKTSSFISLLNIKLVDYIDKLESVGRFWFLKKEALDFLGCSEMALKESIKRLIRKKRLSLVRGDFLVIIPGAYKNKGIIPADWFINSLMESMNLGYYVSLLSAANYYGAAHQKPQVFQVITKKDLRKITKNNLRVEFYRNSNIDISLAKDFQVSTGYIKIASPEVLAFDLVQYYYACGYFSNVATVLSELKESIDPKKLFQIAISNQYKKAVIQRLGYLMSLDEVGGASKISKIKEFVRSENPRFIPLKSGQPYHNMPKDQDWHIWINEKVEVDV